MPAFATIRGLGANGCGNHDGQAVEGRWAPDADSLIAMVLKAFHAVFFGLVLLANAAHAGDDRATSRDVSGVVELFTSQGCASCPPADGVLTTLSRDPRLVTLAYHVDYWDYIGWKDTHGSRDNTERQRAYATSFGSGSIYTPQAVVNGRREVAGAKEGEIRRAVTATTLDSAGSGKPVVTLEIEDGRLHIAAEGGGALAPGRPPVLMLVTFDPWIETAVDRGENEGRTLGSSNAVRSWRILGMWEGRPLAVDIPLAMLREDGKPLGYAAILQGTTADAAPGPILAAAALRP